MFTAELFMMDKIWNQTVSIGGRADKRNAAYEGLYLQRQGPELRGSIRKAADPDPRPLMASKRDNGL